MSEEAWQAILARGYVEVISPAKGRFKWHGSYPTEVDIPPPRRISIEQAIREGIIHPPTIADKNKQ